MVRYHIYRENNKQMKNLFNWVMYLLIEENIFSLLRIHYRYGTRGTYVLGEVYFPTTKQVDSL